MKPKRHIFKMLLLVMLVACLAVGTLFALTACDVVQLTPQEAGIYGKDGKDGKDGVTPHIGEDGYWYFGTEKTDYKAVGTDGTDGQDGQDGQDGVTPHIGEDGYWYFGTEKTDYKAVGTDGTNGTNGKDGTNGVDGKSAYELYVEQYKKEHSGQSEGAMSEEEWLESLQGKDAELEGFLTGTGDPDVSLGAEKDIYLDTETGEIWQKGSVSWSKKGSLGNLSASHIKEIQYNTRGWGLSYFQHLSVLNTAESMGGTLDYDANVAAGGSSIKGYWIIFDNNSALFIQKECVHANIAGQNDPIVLYSNDCTFGTVKILQCAFCGETVTQVEKTSSPVHRYSEEWTSDETHHWHEAVCAHKAELGHKDEGEHTWREYYTVDYDENGSKVNGYIKWQECKVCGYLTNSKISDPSSLVGEDQKVHIHNAEEWEMFVKAVNGDATYGEGNKFAEATVELDESINFGGLTLTPVGLPSNAATVTDRSNGVYLDLKADANIEGGFKGIFNGNGHTLSNFVLDGGNFTGLFGYLNGATITDFTIQNAKVTGDAFVGGVAGFITGEAVRISKVTVINSKVMGYAHIGGIAGYAKDAGPELKTATVSSDAAIKNCTVKATEEVSDPNSENSETMYIISAHSIKDETDNLYFDGACGGGILGTSHSSSVIGCFNDKVNLFVTLGKARIVGVADGTDEAKSIVVGNVINWSKAMGTNIKDKAGVKVGSGRARDCKNKSEFYKTTMDYDNYQNNHGDDFVRNGTGKNTYVYKTANTQSEVAPYAISMAGYKMRLTPRADEKTLDIKDVDALFDFADNIMELDISYANYTIKLTNDIIFGADDIWTPIDKFQPENNPLQNAVFDGQEHIIKGLKTAKELNPAYGVAMFGVITGTFTVQNVTFVEAHTHFHQDEYYGNVVAVVVGYAYGNLTFNNVSVTDSVVWGYGKVGTLLGMGADPGVHITFNNCTATDNHLHGVYNVGGFAGNIQRATNGDDNTEFIGTNNASNNEIVLENNYVTLDGTAQFLPNDRTGTEYPQAIDGSYVDLYGYYYGAVAKYYVSYGSSSHDPVFTGTMTQGTTVTTDFSCKIANSEVCIDTPHPFREKTSA